MPDAHPPLSRRAFLLTAAATAAAVAAGCAGEPEAGTATSSPSSAGDAPAPSSTGAPAPDGADTATSAEPTTTAAEAGPATFVVKGSGDDDVVALTFHTNGDLGLAEQLIATLEQRDAVATSFMIGNWLAANPAMADRMAGAGWEFANHTYTHPGFASLSEVQMADEIERCREVLVELTGDPGRLFRPSGVDDGTVPPSATVLAVAGAAGYEVILGWDVEPYDYKDPGAAAVERAVREQVGPGSVVSLHLGHPGTVQALDPILDILEERGLRTVTASELLGR